MSIEKAIQRLNNKELSDIDIMSAFDLIGYEYLNGEISYLNNFNGFCDLINDFELESNEILQYMLENENYSISDLFVVFDGETLASFDDLDYFETMLKEKMNGECAEFIMGC